jgi:hypothetical protein
VPPHNLKEQIPMTEYLMAVHGDEESYTKVAPEDMQRQFAQVDVFNAELQAAGKWVFGGGLEPASTATVVRADGGDAVLTDGPYLETKEHIGGFWVITAADLDEALDWARKASAACEGPVEVRPFQSEA